MFPKILPWAVWEAVSISNANNTHDIAGSHHGETESVIQGWTKDNRTKMTLIKWSHPPEMIDRALLWTRKQTHPFQLLNLVWLRETPIHWNTNISTVKNWYSKRRWTETKSTTCSNQRGESVKMKPIDQVTHWISHKHRHTLLSSVHCTTWQFLSQNPTMTWETMTARRSHGCTHPLALGAYSIR